MPSTPHLRSAACWGFLWRSGTLVLIQGTAESPLSPPPLIALCALSSGTLRLSRILAPAHPAGLVDDPAIEGRETITSVQTGQWTLLGHKTKQNADTITSTRARPINRYEVIAVKLVLVFISADK